MPPVLDWFEELNGTQKFNKNYILNLKSNLQPSLRGSLKCSQCLSETFFMTSIQLFPMVGHLNTTMLHFQEETK